MTLSERLDDIHWPQAIILCVFLVCFFGAPVLFFHLVDYEVLKLIFELPWLTILGPGVMAVVAAATAIRAFFSRKSVTGKTAEVVARMSAPEKAPE